MSHTRTARKDYAKWSVDQAIHEAFAAAGRDDRLRQAFRQSLIAVQARSTLLRANASGGCRGWEQPAYFVSGLLALARHRRDWIREPEKWQPPIVSPRDTFRALALYLLATHHVPSFMTSVWLREDSPQVRREQKWFKHVARGHNIRGADIPKRLNKKMAYCFSLAPDHYTVDAALAWGEACRTPKAKKKSPCLTTRRRLKRQRGRRARAWSWAQWKAIPVSDFRYVEPAKHEWSHQVWTIEQIVDERSLFEEGEAMSHCVGSYTDRCASGKTSIWSLMSHGTITHRRVVTIEVDPATRTIMHALGLRNSSASNKPRRIISMWATKEGLEMSRWF